MHQLYNYAHIRFVITSLIMNLLQVLITPQVIFTKEKSPLEAEVYIT